MLPLPPDHRPSLEELTVRLAGVERRNRRLAGALAAMPVAAILIALGLTEFGASAKADPAVSPILRVRELAVVDDAGVVRARVGSDLPDAIIDGKRIGRGGEKVSGIMLYDGTGQERGGYVTFEPSGNIGLTLDSAKAQTTLLIAGRDGGSALQLWTRDGAIELRSDEDGSRLTGTRAGRILAQVPAITNMTGPTCSAYKEALSRVSPAQVAKDCERRFPAEACGKCLGDGPG